MANKVTIVGSGNWGSVIAMIIGDNVTKKSALFDQEVRMWVFEEIVPADAPKHAGRKLTEVINETHENVKYLPGYTLPSNVIAVPDVVESIKGSNLLVFVVPHQFLKRILSQIKPHIAPGTRAISLMKGIDFDDNGVVLLSNVIKEDLGVSCSVLMGANVASQVAARDPAEATVGSHDKETGEVFRQLFDRPKFRVNAVEDVAGVELCGALKNIVALGAGFCDGLGFKDNTKAAIVRIGLVEMRRFAETFYPPGNVQTYFESCGVADLVTTCYAGRNRRVAEAFVKTGKPWDELETEMLDGQKLQGTLTAKEVNVVLTKRGLKSQFPLFTVIHDIAFNGLPAHNVVDSLDPVE